MSLPNVPDINPLITLTREKVFYLLLTSVAMEEISLSHIMNAEGEKIQKILNSNDVCLEDLLLVNKSVDRIMRSIMKNQLLLLCKLEDILSLEQSGKCHEHDEE